MPHDDGFSTRRFFILGGLQAIGLGVLGLRLFDLQILQNAYFQKLVEKNRRLTRQILAPRGIILDRTGVVLAQNTNVFRAFVLWDHVDTLDAVLRVFCRFIPLDNDEHAYIKLQVHKHKKDRSLVVYLKDNLAWDQVVVLEKNHHHLPGVGIETGFLRAYPFGMLTAHSIGCMGPARSGIPGLRVGKSGVERAQDAALQGQSGVKEFEVNARRMIVQELTQTPPTPGKPVQTSLLQALQQDVADICTTTSGAAVVLKNSTGEVLALHAWPSYDANIFSQAVSAPTWRGLCQDPLHPMLNRALAGAYPPGSVVKMALGLAGLEGNVITGSTKIVCAGSTEVGGHRFHCYRGRAHGALCLRDAIIQSCDCFFYELGLMTGIAAIAPMFSALGLGQIFMPELGGVAHGLVPTPYWKRKHRHAAWSRGDTVATSIGQGFVLATPLQLAVMAARLATGRMVVPSYLKVVDQKPAFAPCPIKAQHLALVQQGMHGVVNAQHGIAFDARLTSAFGFAGKTGTSQVKSISRHDRAAGRFQSNVWAEKDHGIFCGYAPAENPLYSFAVVAEHADTSRVAAFLARDIVRALGRHRP